MAAGAECFELKLEAFHVGRGVVAGPFDGRLDVGEELLEECFVEEVVGALFMRFREVDAKVFDRDEPCFEGVRGLHVHVASLHHLFLFRDSKSEMMASLAAASSASSSFAIMPR